MYFCSDIFTLLSHDLLFTAYICRYLYISIIDCLISIYCNFYSLIDCKLQCCRFLCESVVKPQPNQPSFVKNKKRWRVRWPNLVLVYSVIVFLYLWMSYSIDKWYFSTKPRDWLGRMFPKNDHLTQKVCNTLKSCFLHGCYTEPCSLLFVHNLH